jgi:hypothetical protein
MALLCALVLLAGCAKTTVVNQTPMTNPNLPFPNEIWVYDFVGSPADIPPDSSIAGMLGAPSIALDLNDVTTGRELGHLIAKELVADLQAMGMPAALGAPDVQPGIGDGVIRGYIVSADAGSAAGRFFVGFGKGTAEMDTVVEGYVMTQNGLHKLGSGTLSASGNKTPGVVLPAAVAIASGSPVGLIVVGSAKIYGNVTGRSGLQGRAKSTADEIAAQLKIRFQDRGWIS